MCVSDQGKCFEDAFERIRDAAAHSLPAYPTALISSGFSRAHFPVITSSYRLRKTLGRSYTATMIQENRFETYKPYDAGLPMSFIKNMKVIHCFLFFHVDITSSQPSLWYTLLWCTITFPLYYGTSYSKIPITHDGRHTVHIDHRPTKFQRPLSTVWNSRPCIHSVPPYRILCCSKNNKNTKRYVIIYVGEVSKPYYHSYLTSYFVKCKNDGNLRRCENIPV